MDVDAANKPGVQRDVLELRMVMQEQVIPKSRCREGMAAPELAKRMPRLFARQRLVNERLAELRGVGGTTQCSHMPRTAR